MIIRLIMIFKYDLIIGNKSVFIIFGLEEIINKLNLIIMEFPLAFGIEKTGLPLILSSGKLQNICFLIDTGASHNYIFNYVYEHFKDEFTVLGDKQQI